MKYATTMIDVAERTASSGGSPAGALAFGASLRSRIAALRPAARWPRGLQVAAVCAVPALLLACSAARPASTSAMGAVSGTHAPGEVYPSPAPAGSPQETAQIAEDLDNTRLITVRVADIDPIELGLARPGDGLVVRAGERSEFQAFFNSPWVGQFLAAPQVLVNLGQEAQVEMGSQDGVMAIRLVVWPSERGTNLLGIGYQETVGGEVVYNLSPTNVQFPSTGQVMVRLPGNATHRARTLLITVGFSPEANPGC